eukprot:gene36224-47119_t
MRCPLDPMSLPLFTRSDAVHPSLNQRRAVLRHGVIAALAAGGLKPLHAAETPPLQLVVPVPPGGSVDLTARLLSERLPTLLQQKVVVENRPGASGSIAAAGVARAA